MLPPTRDNNIVLVPHEVLKNGVGSMGSIWDKHDFVEPGTDERGHAASGGYDVFRKVQLNKPVYIFLQRCESSLASSRDRNGNGTVRTWESDQIMRVEGKGRISTMV